VSRNLLKVENASNLSRDELVRTFVVTPDYLELLNPVNHVVLGARGSGKTVLLRMLSHDHMSQVDDDRVRPTVRDCSLIGIYVQMDATWVSGLKNKPWQTEEEQERYFQWRLNLSACIALTDTIGSCLREYVSDVGDRASKELDIVAKLSEAWLGADAPPNRSLSDLAAALEEIEYEKQVQAASWHASGGRPPEAQVVAPAFETDLFTPVTRGIVITQRLLGLTPEPTWAILLDEAEFLEELHHRLINTHMRSHAGNLVFKLSTLPYYHPTLETNTGDSLSVGDDFSYLYIDQDPVRAMEDAGFVAFAQSLLDKRMSANDVPMLNLSHLLGGSRLLEDSDGASEGDEQFFALLEKYASPVTVQRAHGLQSNPPAFRDQISRKMKGALFLRDAVETRRRDHLGRQKLDVYSGERMILRCTDANPRRMVQLFQRIVRAYTDSGGGGMLDTVVQTQVLRSYSEAVLRRSESTPGCGHELYAFLRSVGFYLRTGFYERELTTDQVFSIEVKREDGGKWPQIVREAAKLGLMYPNVQTRSPEFMPMDGIFHLAYALAPVFDLLPRRGKAVRLTTVLRFSSKKAFVEGPEGQGVLWPSEKGEPV